jgi:hypothetical protein
MMSIGNRNRILAELAKYTGKHVPWQFLSQTKDYLAGIERFHYLISGIYKPAGSDYALSIVTKVASPYDRKDEVVFLHDGRWLMTYSPRSGGLNQSDNRALVKCMDDRVPLGVFKQVEVDAKQKGSTYLVMELGLITNYDAKADVFVIESIDRQALEQVTNVIADEKARYEIQLYAQLTNEFQPFVETENATRTINVVKRDAAFREIVLLEYSFTCAVCGMRFRLNDLVEATAAHIVPKRKNGTDDPRNGLALCRTHHWAFDAGVFSLTDRYEILPTPAIDRADSKNFGLAEMRGKTIMLPKDEISVPHLKAIQWHRSNVLM